MCDRHKSTRCLQQVRSTSFPMLADRPSLSRDFKSWKRAVIDRARSVATSVGIDNATGGHL